MIGMGFQTAKQRHIKLANRPRCAFAWTGVSTDAADPHVCTCVLVKNHPTNEHRCKCRATRSRRKGKGNG